MDVRGRSGDVTEHYKKRLLRLVHLTSLSSAFAGTLEIMPSNTRKPKTAPRRRAQANTLSQDDGTSGLSFSDCVTRPLGVDASQSSADQPTDSKQPQAQPSASAADTANLDATTQHQQPFNFFSGRSGIQHLMRDMPNQSMPQPRPNHSQPSPSFLRPPPNRPEGPAFLRGMIPQRPTTYYPLSQPYLRPPPPPYPHHFLPPGQGFGRGQPQRPEENWQSQRQPPTGSEPQYGPEFYYNLMRRTRNALNCAAREASETPPPERKTTVTMGTQTEEDVKPGATTDEPVVQAEKRRRVSESANSYVSIISTGNFINNASVVGFNPQQPAAGPSSLSPLLAITSGSWETLTPRQYVDELEMLPLLASNLENGEYFAEFYKFLTKLQIMLDGSPIGFRLFRKLYNARHLENVERQFARYIQKTVVKAEVKK